MKRRWKILIGVAVVLAALLALNAFSVNRETKDAELTVDGAEIVRVEGRQIQVLDTGQRESPAPPIVLLHCYTCAIDWWDGVIPLLARERRVIAIDLLGHGGSEKPKSGYSMEDQAGLVAQVLNQLEVEGATVVGHSLGGTVATALAEQSSELVERLVIIDQAPDNSFGNLDFLAKLSLAPVIGPALWRVTPDVAYEEGLSQAFAPGFDVPDAFVDDLRRMTFTSYQDSPEAEDDFTEEIPLDERATAAFARLMVIFGAEDQIYDADASLEAYRSVPGVRTELIEGAGHSPNVEAPARTAALILEFAKPLPVAEIPEPPETEAQKPTIERSGQLAGTLVASPLFVGPAGQLTLFARNAGKAPFRVKPAPSFERRSGGKWVDVSAQAYSKPLKQVRANALPETVPPGAQTELLELRLAPGLRPGIYRVRVPAVDAEVAVSGQKGQKNRPKVARLSLEARISITG